MSVIMVTYDLHKPGDKGYDALYDYLRTYECRHPVESVWFLDTLKPTETIIDDMMKILPYPSHDRLIVIRQKKKGWTAYRAPKLSAWFSDPKRTWDL